MESSMSIPLGIKILVLVLSALTLFTLAARELVAEWLMGAAKSVARLLRLRSRRTIPGVTRERVKLDKPSVAR
jgi:hypothetical protein